MNDKFEGLSVGWASFPQGIISAETRGSAAKSLDENQYGNHNRKQAVFLQKCYVLLSLYTDASEYFSAFS